jgi:hypothetical protein
MHIIRGSTAIHRHDTKSHDNVNNFRVCYSVFASCSPNTWGLVSHKWYNVYSRFLELWPYDVEAGDTVKGKQEQTGVHARARSHTQTHTYTHTTIIS